MRNKTIRDDHPIIFWISVIAIVYFFLVHSVLWLIGALIAYIVLPAMLIVIAIWLISKR